eukprot:GHVO01052457.1.p1 GENE.GHVO01052457.1~~GHVO01052457.1.p1  ORF type:complete len:387 (-),score=58.90 GHVO01052457.1:492-1652(-)
MTTAIAPKDFEPRKRHKGIQYPPWQNIDTVWYRDFGTVVGGKVACLDMDGTIIVTKSGRRFPRDDGDWKLYDAGVPKKLKEVHQAGYRIVIFSNQNGVQKKKQTVESITQKVDAIQIAVDCPILVYIMIGVDKYRKPCKGAWDLLAAATPLDRAASYYVGDAAGRKGDFSDTDRKFAKNIGIDFFTPEAYFLGQGMTLPDLPPPYRFGGDPNAFRTLVRGDGEQEILLLVGPPASGKSHTVRVHFSDYTRVNQDTLKRKEKCHKVCGDALKEGKSVIIDNQNLSVFARAPYINLAKTHSVRCRAVYLDVPKEFCFFLNRYRTLCVDTIEYRDKEVPPMVIHGFFKNIQRPTEKEGLSTITLISESDLAMESPLPPNAERYLKLYLI